MLILLSGCRPAARNELSPTLTARKSPRELAVTLQPPDPNGTRRTFDEIVALPDEKFDVAEAILALASEIPVEAGGTATPDIAATLTELDRLADRAKTDLPDNPDGIDIFDTLYEVVLDRKAADPYRDDRADNYDLPLAARKHRGSCLSVGIMTLSVARRMGVPVYGVQCPAHFFLKYLARPGGKDAKDAATLNFDVTRPTPDNWKKLDDDFYRKWQRIDTQAEMSGAYLRPLSDREVVSTYLASRSGFFSGKKLYAKALADAERALALNPRNVTACVNAGFANEAAGDYEEAARHYNRALQIDPESVRAMNNLAYLKVRDQSSSIYDLKGAEKLIQTALREQPGSAFLHATNGEVAAARRDWRAAGRSMQDALRIEPKNAVYRERFMFFRDKLRAEK